MHHAQSRNCHTGLAHRDAFSIPGAWSEQEYLALEINRRVEFDNGFVEVHDAPADQHQAIISYFISILRALAKQIGGVERPAGLRLRLWDQKHREPDIVFLRDRNSSLRHENYIERMDKQLAKDGTMRAGPASASESVLLNVQAAAPGLVRAFDSEHSTRFEAALEALAPNTRRAYGGALAAWSRWAALQGVHALAAPPFALRAYLQERAAAGVGISSLRLTVAALRKLQALVGVEPTANDQVVTDTISGLARQAAAPKQAYALTAEALAVITATACQPRVGRGGRLESPEQARRRGLVDIALCRVLSDAGLRRSEAAALVWEDAARWDDGSGRLTVGRSKTDAEARTVYLTPASLAALEAMRPAGADGSASLFGLSAPSISRRIHAAAAAAGLGSGFSGHSGRVGMARRMAAAGAPTHEIMAQGRWKTARMVEAYTRAEEAGRAAKWLA